MYQRKSSDKTANGGRIGHHLVNLLDFLDEQRKL